MGWISATASLFGLGKKSEQPGEAANFWYEDIGTAQTSGSGIKVTPDIAIKASAVYACVRVLAETIATLPLHIYRQLPNGGLEPAPQHPLDDIIRFQPNGIQTAVEFWETAIFHAALRGNGYAEIIPGARGAVDQLEVIPANNILRTEILPNKTLRIEFRDKFTNRNRILLQEEIFRIPGMSSDGLIGLSAVDMAAEAIGIGMAADQYAARVFSNKMNIGGFLVHPGRLSKEAQGRVIQKVAGWMGVGNMHRPMVLMEGMKFERASMDADEAQLLEARKWQISEVARYWRIPLHMLGIDDQTNRSTVEEQSINFVKYTIRPWVRRIEQAIRRDLIIAKGVYEAKFNLDGLQRGNLEARANYYSKASGAGGSPGWMTQNEIRINEGLNPIDDPQADKLAVGTNPSQEQQLAPQKAKPSRRRDDDEEAHDLTIEDRAERLVRKENTAVRKAVMKHADDPDALRTWLGAFYGGHVSTVVSILGIPKEAARAYCEFQRDQALKVNDIVALIERREETLAEEVAATLRQHGGDNG